MVTAGTLPQGEVGIAYPSTAFTATGGTPPYTWSLSGAPTWLSLSGNTASGTPDASGTTSFTVQATDAAGQVATSPRSVDIQPALVVTGSCSAAPCSVEEGCTTVCGGFGSQSGGVPPFKYTPQGTLPSGMGLSGLSLTGAFPLGSYKFGVGVTDSLGANVSIAAAFDVFAHIALADGSCQVGLLQPCPVRMVYSSGTGKPRSAALDPKTPAPPGTTVQLSAGVVLVTFPATDKLASGTVQVILTDGAQCGPSAGQLCTTVGTASYRIG